MKMILFSPLQITDSCSVIHSSWGRAGQQSVPRAMDLLGSLLGQFLDGTGGDMLFHKGTHAPQKPLGGFNNEDVAACR